MVKKQSVIKWLAFFVFSLPAMGIIYAITQNSLGPDPAEALSHTSGAWSMRLLLLTLLLSSLARQVPFCKRGLIIRRMCGLFVFAYSSFHLFVFIALYAGFDGLLLINELGERPYIAVGFIAWLLLLPLAVTSNGFMIRRLGSKHWKLLHRLVYAVLLLVVAHVVWQVRSDWSTALIYSLCTVLLFLERLLGRKQRSSKA